MEIQSENCVSMKTCEYCTKTFVPYLANQRFCNRACSDAWHMQERREAVEWYRAYGMRPETKANRAREIEHERNA